MFPVNFNSHEEIRKKISKISSLLDFDTYQSISRIYYDTIKIAKMRLDKKREISVKKRKEKREKFYLSRKNIAEIIRLLTYFHINDIRYTEILNKSTLAQCYNTDFTEDDAWTYVQHFIRGMHKDKYGIEIKFTDDFVKCLYKDEEGRHIKESENYNPYRGKRLPLILDTLKNTENVLVRIDERENLERMYINRYKDFLGHEYYFVVIAEKYYKDKVNPFIAKTAFPIFQYNAILRRIEKYKPPI
jgi:hypothetical protein